MFNEQQRDQIMTQAENKFGAVIEFINNVLLIKRPTKPTQHDGSFMTIKVGINENGVGFHDGHYDMPLLPASESLYERAGKDREYAPSRSYALNTIEVDEHDKPISISSISCATEQEMKHLFIDKFKARGLEPDEKDFENGFSQFEDGEIAIMAIAKITPKN